MSPEREVEQRLGALELWRAGKQERDAVIETQLAELVPAVRQLADANIAAAAAARAIADDGNATRSWREHWFTGVIALCAVAGLVLQALAHHP